MLVLFYKDISPQWQIQLIAILEKIFTGQQISVDEVIRNINIKIRELSLTSLDLKSLSQTVILGLMLLEFLINLNGMEKKEKLSQNAPAITTEVEKYSKIY